MRRFQFIRREDRAAIDLTPMLDVVFILLIFFVVTATFLHAFGLALPGSDSGNDGPSFDNILVQIKPNNDIIINGDSRPVVPNQLRSAIGRLSAQAPEATVIIQPEDGSQVLMLVRTMDAARQAGVTAISVVPSV